ncbi:unnamed protein product [Sphenostylis stenocarpa]|uniref:Uncharacterized protein n=1 Tax=Sphenostylis stenocarpa TaxID=92480 RepID=A0AA86T107_9FABA|nr:unnamed protein product [Sphenostylis stenocarpa]
MLHDPRMHRASTSTHAEPPQHDDIQPNYNTLEAEGTMDEKRHSSFSDLGMPNIFGAYAPIPPSAQGFEGPYQQSPYYIQYHNETVSSSDTYKAHEDVEHHEAQPLEEEAPRLPQGRRNPTRNKRRPRFIDFMEGACESIDRESD